MNVCLELHIPPTACGADCFGPAGLWCVRMPLCLCAPVASVFACAQVGAVFVLLLGGNGTSSSRLPHLAMNESYDLTVAPWATTGQHSINITAPEIWGVIRWV